MKVGDPVDPVDPTGPGEPGEPVDPADPGEPGNPVMVELLVMNTNDPGRHPVPVLNAGVERPEAPMSP